MKSLIYPKHIKCIFCGEELPSINQFDCCDKCQKKLPSIKENFCLRCGAKLIEEAEGVCNNCKSNNFYFNYSRSVFSYENEIKNAIYKFKYERAKYLSEPLANFMCVLLQNLNYKFDTITYTPLHNNRQKIRGYNQAEELAKIIAKRFNKPLVKYLERIVDTPSQTKLSSKERKENIKDAFKLINKDIVDRNILIIDDVYTTGATTNEIARVLKNARAENIYVLALAHSNYKENSKE